MLLLCDGSYYWGLLEVCSSLPDKHLDFPPKGMPLKQGPSPKQSYLSSSCYGKVHRVPGQASVGLNPSLIWLKLDSASRALESSGYPVGRTLPSGGLGSSRKTEMHTHGVFFLLLPLDTVASASRKYAMQCAFRGTAIVLGDPPTLG